ncbi:branched-chain amino acid transport system substrate-binding protein [Amaricoccus macauensis]|uniref:Branched-chain amino acid transport system substrate-binding protein n=1 Tax=Amaricoccus macauensis TaxID=57001 RepID=A0A840SSZ3_9RHOB|nr:ABC transporter substrate-binding protein [Amaricoccus macauensis]MBB5222322.1 branched-chain amino acid transport system substrate-binding protein [Amaricoccus macauensis]
MKRILTTAALAAILAASTATAAPLKVGFISTLSGGGAGLGIDARDGFLLALKQAGDAGSEITVITEDDQQKPEIGVQLADKMIQSDKVDILTGIIFSNIALAVVPAAVKQDKFYLSVNAGPSQLAGKGCDPNYFNVAYQNDNQHEAMGEYSNTLGYKNAFILAPNYPAGKDSLNGFKRFYKGELAGENYVKLGQTDFAAEIAQIKASGADSVFFFLPGGMGISFIKQFSNAGTGLPMMGPGFSFDQDVLPAVGDAALGAHNAAQWSPDLDNPANKAFVEAFEAEYKRLPSVYASQGYDTALLILSAQAKADIADHDAYHAALKAADFPTVRGSFRFGNNQHPIQNFYAREVVKRDDGVVTNKIVGTAFEDHVDAYAAECPMK